MKIHEKFEKEGISPTNDLIQYFEKKEFKKLREKTFRIYLLDVVQSLQYAKDISYLNVAEELGLLPLEDANNSNPYCYITKGIARGKIIHLNHEGESRIKFNSIQEFTENIRRAINDGIDIDDLEWEKKRITCNQSSLGKKISILIDNESDNATEIALIYLMLLDGNDREIFTKLAENDDFFIQEATADRLFELKDVELLEVAQKISNSKHPQAKAAGEKAVKEIKKTLHLRNARKK